MSIELKDNKKACILRAAEQEFMQKGFDGARMVEIAKRAGVGHPLLHYHFHTKEESAQCGPRYVRRDGQQHTAEIASAL